MHIDATPFAFVFLINNYRIQFVIAAYAVILFCNAPFEDESYQYMISRAGKLSWGLGQDLGDVGENKCRSRVRRGIVSISEYYTAI